MRSIVDRLIGLIPNRYHSRLATGALPTKLTQLRDIAAIAEPAVRRPPSRSGAAGADPQRRTGARLGAALERYARVVPTVNGGLNWRALQAISPTSNGRRRRNSCGRTGGSVVAGLSVAAHMALLLALRCARYPDVRLSLVEGFFSAHEPIWKTGRMTSGSDRCRNAGVGKDLCRRKSSFTTPALWSGAPAIQVKHPSRRRR